MHGQPSVLKPSRSSYSDLGTFGRLRSGQESVAAWGVGPEAGRCEYVLGQYLGRHSSLLAMTRHHIVTQPIATS